MNAIRHLLALSETAIALEAEQPCLPIAEAVPRPGETIAAFLARTGWDVDGLPTVVCRPRQVRRRKGVVTVLAYYGREEWLTRKIRANDNFLVISRPAGGGGGGGGGQGKQIGAAVAMIALAVLAPYAVGALGVAALGSVGSLTLAGHLVATALIAGGSMLLSHFLQPKPAAPTDRSPDLYSFAFAGNQARPQQVIPVGYGRRLIYPDFGAPTYSEFDGDAMLDFGLYCIGCGRYQLEELRLSDTPIWTREAGFLSGFSTAFEMQIVEPGDDVTLFPVNVTTSSEVAGLQLSANVEENGAEDATIGPFAANPAGTSASELICDFVFPSGLYFQKGTQTLSDGVQLNVLIAPIDDLGLPTGAAVLHVEVFTAAKNSQLRFTKRYAVAPGRYSVAVQRYNREPTQEGAVDGVVWSALRAHIEGPQSFEGVTMLALKARADNGLQTLTGGRIGAVATRILPVFTEAEGWVEQPTRAIAWAALDAWTNEDYSAGLPIDGVDLVNFALYDAFWSDAGHTFDHSFTEAVSVIDAVETILRAGRAVPAILGDQLSIMREEDQQLPSLFFTDRNIVRKSLSIEHTLYNSGLADGVVGSYLDETTWRISEVSSAPDGETLANPARVELTGVTKRGQAVGLVRFQAAESRYRRTQVSFQVEAEGLLVRRGMSIAVQSELPQVWGDAGSVLAVSGYQLTLDHAPTWTGAHYIELVGRDGSYWGPVAVSQGAAANIAVVNATDAALVASQTGASLAAVLTRSADQEAPSYNFGTASHRAIRCLVKEGSPSGKYLQIVAVNDDERVYDVTETGVEPLKPPGGFLRDTDPPVIAQLSGQMVQEGLAAKLSGGWNAAKNALTYEARISYDAGASWTNVYSGIHTSFQVVVNPADLALQVRGISSKGVPGAWSQAAVSGITLVVDGTDVDVKVDIDSLIGEAEAQMKLISGLGAGSIADLERRVFRLNEEIANAQATIAGHSYYQRQLIKVTLTEDVTRAFAAIQTEQTARISDTQALASTTNTLAVRLGSAESQIATEQTVRATQDQALATSVTTLQSRITNSEMNVAGQAVAISSLQTSVTQNGANISAVSTQYTGLNSRLTTAEGKVTAQASQVSQLQTSVTTINGQVTAQSSNLNALSTTLNDHTALLTTYSNSINGLEVQYGVVGTIDGYTGGFILQGIRRNDGAVSYNVVFNADVIVDGTLTARKIQDLSISATKIQDLAVSTTKISPAAVSSGVAFGAGVGSAVATIFVGQGCSVMAIFSMDQFYTAPPNSGAVIGGYVNGVPLVLRSLGYGPGSSWIFFPQTSAGAWQNNGGDTYVTVQTNVSPALNCSVYAVSFKK